MSTLQISPEEVWNGQGLPEDFFLMDVRTPAEFMEAHIPGSVNIPLGEMERQLAAVKSRASSGDMAIVCHTRFRSQVVYNELKRLGIRDAPILRGGISSWIEKGLPVNRGEKTVSLQRQVQIAAGSLTVLGVLLGAFVHPAFLALSGFIGAGLVHAGATDTCAFAVLLSKLPYNRR